MGILFSPNFLKHWLPVLGELSTAFILPPEILDTRGTINCFFLVGGFNLPLWKMIEFVSWDYEISNTMGKNMFQTTNQMIFHGIFDGTTCGIWIQWDDSMIFPDQPTATP